MATILTMSSILQILTILLVRIQWSNSFNLETRVPVIKLGGDYANSYFGYSVAQHRTRDNEPVLLVGAPQDRNLQPGTNSSGALYRCPVSSDTRDCVQVITDGRRHNKGKYSGIYDGAITDLRPPITSEIKDGQWLGVAVSSQGGVLLDLNLYTLSGGEFQPNFYFVMKNNDTNYSYIQHLIQLCQTFVKMTQF